MIPHHKNNEDRLVSDEQLGLFVVADGMGGHNAGKVAYDNNRLRTAIGHLSSSR